MNTKRKVMITITYNEIGIIIDTKAEEVAQPTIKPDDGLERWAKVCLSISVGVIVWIVIGMTIVFICGMILGGTLGFLVAAVLSMEGKDR